ncbi:ArsR/SmtB family transcription factor [Paractinoplanes maris]|uniref:ArsR/SmtB family transcription factor n=1 Tax=Paractinoplanes maris TaxID=1734446 RepID=UPI00202190FC|nr:helix-turn-helix domain-containing protein [Actinoplanes maris]
MSDDAGRGGVRITDPQVMRALAHPARIAIVEYLNNTGAVVTATETAELVGLSPSATSYHLRELAKYGLVEQAASRGDGRERVWQSTSTGLRIDADRDQPGAAAATEALVDIFLERDVDRARRWIRRQPAEPEQWRDVGTMTSHKLLMTAEELRVLSDKITELTAPYRFRERQDGAPEGARPVHVGFMAFPDDEKG